MKKSRPMIAGLALLALAGSLAAAAPASAESTSGTTTTIPMSVDCSKTTPEQIAAGHAQGWDFCGGGTSSTATPGGAVQRDRISADCGTASIYADRVAKGKGHVSWSLFSTKGNILHRDLVVNWGPAGSTSFPDISFMNSADYSKTKTVLASGKLGANMHGFVVVGSLQVSCTIPSVYADSVNI